MAALFDRLNNFQIGDNGNPAYEDSTTNHDESDIDSDTESDTNSTDDNGGEIIRINSMTTHHEADGIDGGHGGAETVVPSPLVPLDTIMESEDENDNHDAVNKPEPNKENKDSETQSDSPVSDGNSNTEPSESGPANPINPESEIQIESSESDHSSSNPIVPDSIPIPDNLPLLQERQSQLFLYFLHQELPILDLLLQTCRTYTKGLEDIIYKGWLAGELDQESLSLITQEVLETKV